MGLLPIIEKALGLFSFLSFTALAISFILYKMRSPKNKPYNRTSNIPYQQAQQNYRPAFQAAYYQTAGMVPSAPQAAAVKEKMDVSERRFVPERTEYTERNASERRNINENREVQERRSVQKKKVKARPVSKFQLLHSTEDGEIKAYHLPTRNY